jgi:hypothetical protein
MSVPEGKRGESKLEIFIKAKQLATYTITICCNENVFLPKYQNAITNDIMQMSKNIFIWCWSANNVRVIDKNTYKERTDLQRQAHRECNNMLALIQIAGSVFHLRNKRLKYWGSLILEVRNMISKWHDNDKQRYKEYGA